MRQKEAEVKHKDAEAKLEKAEAKLKEASNDLTRELARTAIANAQHEIRITLAGLDSAQSLSSALTQEVIRLRSLCSGLFTPSYTGSSSAKRCSL